jgi:uncharacterized protein YqeY
MRRALTAAMKARDQPAVTALRSALAAIDNAEAVDIARTTPTGEAHPAVAGEVAGGETTGRDIADGEIADGEVAGGGVAGAVVGLGAAEVERRTLTSAEMEAIVLEEVAERLTAARAYERAGQSGHAERLRAEAEVLSAYLGDPGAGVGDSVVDPGDPGA